MPQGRVFRVFVSSTFADLRAEREALQAFVFPRLRDLCAHYGTRFQAVDLRWGISPDAAEDQQTIDMCLREVDRCRRLTPRPNFLILLGERYGWRPLPPTIPAGDVHALAAVAAPADRALIDQWYWCDDNAVPPAFVLRPRGAAPSDGPWPEVEVALSGALDRGLTALGWSGPQLAPYVASATEREIERGVFVSDGAGEHVAAVSRVIDGLPRDGGAGVFVDTGDLRPPGGTPAERLEALRQRLRERLGPGLVELTTGWADGAPSPRHVGSLPSSLDDCLALLDAVGDPPSVCEAVWCSLGRVIRAECIELTTRSPLERERHGHIEFRDDRAALFIGREIELARIADYIAGDEPWPLAVLGGQGSGKSALLARAALDAEVSTGAAGAHVIARFVGATAASTSGVQLISGLGAELGGGVDDAPGDLHTLTRWLPTALERAAEQGPLVIFIDALDQLATGDGARTLAWLPYMLPPGVRVVISAAPGDVTDVIEGRQRHESAILRVGPLPDATGAELLDTWLQGANRALRPEERREVLTVFGRSGSPLHLRLGFEEARRWRSFDPPAALADDVPGLVRDLLARLSSEANHGEILVGRSLGYLLASRRGLTEDEILDVLSADTVVMDEMRRRSPNSPATDRLPPIIWSRLYDELDPYLTWRDADGTATMSFFHRQLADIFSGDLLGPEDRHDRHARLADYFDARPATVGPAGTVDLRRRSELPWHLAASARWDRFVDVVCDFAFLDAGVRIAGPQAVIDDLDLALDVDDARIALSAEALDALTTLRGAIRLSAHVLARDHGQFGAQLIGRIDPGDNHWLGTILDGARTQPSHATLRPAGPTLAAPGGDLIATLPGHASAVRSIAITPDGLHGVSGSADGTLRVWDLDRQAERFVIPVGHGEVWSVAVTPGGELAVSGSEDGSIDMWDIASGARVRRWQGDGRWRSLAITPDGRRLLSGSDGPAVLWDAVTGDPITRIEPAGTATSTIALSGDGRLMMIGGVYDDVYLWDLVENRALERLRQGDDSWVSAVAITADGRWAFSADWEGRIKVWDVDRRRQIGQYGGHGYEKLSSIVVTPDGSRVVTADVRGRIVVHVGVDPAFAGDRVDDVILKVVGTSGHRVQQLALTPDGRRAITSGLDGTLRIWDVATDAAGEPGMTYSGGYGDDDAAFEAWWRRVLVTETHAPAAPALDVRRLPVAAGDRWSVVPVRHGRPPGWDDDDDAVPTAFTVVDDTRAPRSPEIETGFCLTVPALSNDGMLVAFVDLDWRVSVWDVATGSRTWSAPLDTTPMTRQVLRLLADAVVVFSPDRQSLLCAIDGAISVWDVVSGRKLAAPSGAFAWDRAEHGGPRETTPRFTPDGRHIIAMTTPTAIGVWRVGMPECIARRSVPTSSRKAGLGSDGGSAWWFGDDHRLRHWSIAEAPPAAAPLGRARTFPVDVPSIRVSADGDAAVGLDGECLNIWQLPHRRPVIRLPADGVQSVAIALTSPTGAPWRGLLARGGSRLEVFALPSLALVAAFDADAAFETCSFLSMSELVGSTVDGRRHRLQLIEPSS